MKWPLILLQAVLSLCLIISCTEKADLDPKEKFVQVYAVLENTDLQKIMLHHTSYVSESLYLPVDKADVVVEEYLGGEKRNSYIFEGKGNGEWVSAFRPVPRAEYRLYVDVSGFSEMRSVTEYPDTLRFIEYKVIQPDYYQNIASEPEMFHFNYKSDSCIIWIYYADYIPGQKDLVISDSTVVGMHKDTKDESYADYTITSPLYMPEYEMFINTDWSCLPELWHYDKYKRYYGPGYCGGARCIPFAAQYQGGYIRLMGFTPDSNDYIFVKGQKYKSSNPMFQHEKDVLLHPNSYVMLQSVDKGYDRYLRECYAFDLGLNRIQESDLTFLWDYKEVYSNIENGCGIFGSTAKFKLYLKDCRGINETPLWDRFDIVCPE